MKIARSLQATRKRRTGQEGFTLIEVAVAAAIAGLVLAGMFKGYNIAGRQAQFAACEIAATSQAMRHLEQVVAADWIPSYGITNLLAMGGTERTNLCLPTSQGNVVNCTNITTVSQISTIPPYAMVKVQCIWSFPTFGGTYTNTVGTIRAPNI